MLPSGVGAWRRLLLSSVVEGCTLVKETMLIFLAMILSRRSWHPRRPSPHRRGRVSSDPWLRPIHVIPPSNRVFLVIFLAALVVSAAHAAPCPSEARVGARHLSYVVMAEYDSAGFMDTTPPLPGTDGRTVYVRTTAVGVPTIPRDGSLSVSFTDGTSLSLPFAYAADQRPTTQTQVTTSGNIVIDQHSIELSVVQMEFTLDDAAVSRFTTTPVARYAILNGDGTVFFQREKVPGGKAKQFMASASCIVKRAAQ